MMMGGGIVVVVLLFFFFLLLIAALVGIGIWVYRQNTGEGSLGTGEKLKTSEDEALDILRRRYANGEISREEFERMRDDLSK